ncbi:response regulator [Thermodesulfobacteriota bacterium]
MDNTYKEEIKRALVDRLYKQGFIGLTATIVNACVLVFLLRNLIPHSTLAYWFSGALLSIIIRLILIRSYKKYSLRVGNPRMWGRLFVFGLALSGLIWGSAGIFLFPLDSTVHQAFLAFVLAGMVAGAVGAFSSLMWAFVAFSFPALLPVFFNLVYIRDEMHIAMAAMTLLFLILTFITAKRINSSTRELFSLKEQFAEMLSNRTVELLKSNRRLEKEIEDRKITERALKESEKKFRDLFDSISDLIYAQDIEGKFLSVNHVLLKTWGYDPEDLIGDTALELMDPKSRPLFESKYLKKVKDDGSYHGIAKLFTKKGEKFYIEFKSTLVCPEEGEPYISGIGREVTDRILAQRKIDELQDQILQAKKMEAIGTLAGGIAHDFNNLLMGIQGNASLLLFDIDPKDKKYGKTKKKIETIEKLVQDGANLTNQLLGFARGGKYESRPADLNKIIAKHNHLFKRTKKEIVINEKFEKNLWTVEVDRSQIEQALLDIYVNAVQAMPQGGNLSVQTENVSLNQEPATPFEVSPGRYVKLAIIDSGIGMDETTRQRIFEPFFTTKGMGRGSGLGLASVYGIIKNHGGFIDVRSSKGEGTIFEIYLPAIERERIKKEDVPERIHKGEGTILLVDDEEMILEVGKKMLKKLDFKVLTAEGGKEAVRLYKRKRGKIDIVILDMIMPDMSGGKTYDKLKETDPEVKVLLSSGYSINGEASEILERGCDGFIQKPFRLEKISQKIMEIMDKR